MARALESKRILVVENEPLLALEIAPSLEDAGASVIGPAANAATAMSLIAQYRFHGALLDANLGGEPVDEIAAALAEETVPFAFVRGYDRKSLPGAFRDMALLNKSFGAEQLLEVAGKLFTAA